MIKPVLHRIVVRQLNVVEEDPDFKRAKAAGIALPKQGQMEREQAAVDRGEVVAVGPQAFLAFNAPQDTVVPGDIIVFARHSGKTVRDPDQEDGDDTKYVAINDEDVVAILSKKDQNV